ncbi:MAG: hypothetical protein BGO98_38825 [Myxococcales bacterium 68-20]|nr:hypothetical protein [Myxococcales bacterium]OJY26321.1 MAG: hypothetical protein BGO98_38825 [Myxococcales bacterium 68-20]
MQFADPRSTATAYLILRHLYDGDIIEWPIPDDHPQREIFAQLEAQGYVARWDRVWPLHDRYRLTERGIAAIESVYRPAGAEAFFEDLRRRNLSPQDRRMFLQQHGLNPALWPLLHDPSTHWSTFHEVGARYHSYVWEDMQPPKRVRPTKLKRGGGGGARPVHHHHHHDHDYDQRRAAHLLDLDREANDPGHTAPGTFDYDVS